MWRGGEKRRRDGYPCITAVGMACDSMPSYGRSLDIISHMTIPTLLL